MKKTMCGNGCYGHCPHCGACMFIYDIESDQCPRCKREIGQRAYVRSETDWQALLSWVDELGNQQVMA